MPAEVTVGLLRKAMEASGKSRFLIDGFPRDPDNLAVWEASASGGSPVIFDFALFLNCPEEVGAGGGGGVFTSRTERKRCMLWGVVDTSRQNRKNMFQSVPLELGPSLFGTVV